MTLSQADVTQVGNSGRAEKARAQTTLLLAGLIHLLHDGYTDMLYVLLPVWQSQFSLGFVALATLRALNVGALATLQIPSSLLARRMNVRTVLVLGTSVSAVGFILAGFSGGLVTLCGALVLVGIGGSAQHPLASTAVSRAYGENARGPLGTYNFAGDLGKAILPPAASVLITMVGWRSTLWIAASLGIVVASLLSWLMPLVSHSQEISAAVVSQRSRAAARGGFGLLFAIGVLDTATRMGFLLFLPFLLKGKGASLATVGLALSLVFIGGAFGKAACGWLSVRLGLSSTVIATEAGTAIGILAVLALPLASSVIVLPLLGVMLNGTSSVLYGTVPELVAAERTEHSFALFYTGILGSSAFAPMFYGRLGDAAGLTWATTAAALTALSVIPLMLLLSLRLSKRPDGVEEGHDGSL